MLRSKALKILGATAALAVVLALVAGPSQAQSPQPANKTAAIGNTIDDQAPNTDHVVLAEQMRVSSPSDLILNLSAECSILTQLVTGDDGTDATGEADTSGTVSMYVKIDGDRVPVAGSSTGAGDNGEVVFCNREYARTVTDNEDPLDGQDREADYIRTRTANAFQWLALNTGVYYDDPANGQNVLDIEVHAVYDDQDATNGACQADFSETCSMAFVGKRTLIVEPTHASVIEATNSSDGGS
jgi:hypothetical protein